MRKLNQLVLALVLATASVPALSCSCVTSATSHSEQVRLDLADAEAVFSAEVVGVDAFPSSSYGEATELQRARLRVIKSWKGQQKPGDIIVTETIITCCMCGLTVKKGQRWLMFMDGTTPYSVSHCSLSGLLSKKRSDVKLLDKLVKSNTAPN